MNAFQTIIGTLKPNNQQPATGTGTESTNQQQESSWLLSSAARSVGSVAGAGNYFFYLF